MAATAKKHYPHEPDYAVAPGEVLQETIDALGISQADLAMRTGLSKKTINQIIHGREPLTHGTALRLERVTRVAAHFWNALEATFRERLARIEEKERQAQDLEWLKTIPTKELIRRGAIQEQEDRTGLLQAILGFFGVNSPKEWQAVWESPRVAFRRSQVFKSNPGAVAAWIRLGEMEGWRLDCQPYDRDKFRKALEQVRQMTVEAPEVFLPRIRDLCAKAGVAVVFTPEIQGAPVSGATQWLTPDKALLQLSLRFKTNDHFWFSFYHEAGHILKHGKKEKFVEDGEDHDTKEEEANRFAQDFLIPRHLAEKLQGVRTRDQIIDFAKAVGIAPGIVLGRLQRMKAIPYQCADNNLKERFQWSEGADGEAKISRASGQSRA